MAGRHKHKMDGKPNAGFKTCSGCGMTTQEIAERAQRAREAAAVRSERTRAAVKEMNERGLWPGLTKR